MSKVAKAILRFLLPIALFVIPISGCAPRSAPPGADVTAGGVAEQASFEFLRWKEGLAIMIWYDFVGESGSFSTSEGARFTPDPIFELQGYAESPDGARFEWKVQTNDGKTARFWIDGTPYDLSDGRLFIVTAKGDGTGVTQLARDLSSIQPNYSSCLAFAKNDPDLAQFMSDKAASTPSPPTPAATLPPMPTPSPTATPTPTPPAPTATPLPPTLTPLPAPAGERILFDPGATQATIEGYLPADGRAIYVMNVTAGQFIEVNAAVGATGRGLRFSIVGADGAVVKTMGEAHVRTVVPSTQDYYVELVSDVDATSYVLSVLIPVRIRFAPGATSAQVAGSLLMDGTRHYVIRALAGQRMIVAPYSTQGQVKLVISGADGQVLLSGRVGPPGGVYDGILPVTQDYLISARAEGGDTDYVLNITIPADEAGSDVVIIGTVLDVSPSARIIMLAEPVEGLSVIALTDASKLLSVAGNEITLRDIRPGTKIQALRPRPCPFSGARGCSPWRNWA